jgi:hypothetical protein
MIRLDEIDSIHLTIRYNANHWSNCSKDEEEFYNRLADAVQTYFMKEKVSVIYKN